MHTNFGAGTNRVRGSPPATSHSLCNRYCNSRLHPKQRLTKRDSRATSLCKSSQTVLSGEFVCVPRKRGTHRFTPKAESSRSRLFAFYRHPCKSLRQFGQSAGTLDFDTKISGSERNPQGFDRTPNQTVSNSRTLWFTEDPLVNGGQHTVAECEASTGSSVLLH
jgi:hypothetical protein